MEKGKKRRKGCKQGSSIGIEMIASSLFYPPPPPLALTTAPYTTHSGLTGIPVVLDTLNLNLKHEKNNTNRC